MADPEALADYAARVKASWRQHARALSWEQKVAIIARMRERDAAIKAARENSQGKAPAER
jgi:hypothetical protein